MEILFYVCAAFVLLLIGGVIAIFLTTSKEEKEEAGYNRKQSLSLEKFKPGDRLHTVNFIKIDGSLRQFDQFIVIEVIGRCVIGWEIPNNGPPQKRSFNIDRLIWCCHK